MHCECGFEFKYNAACPPFIQLIGGLVMQRGCKRHRTQLTLSSWSNVACLMSGRGMRMRATIRFIENQLMICWKPRENRKSRLKFRKSNQILIILSPKFCFWSDLDHGRPLRRWQAFFGRTDQADSSYTVLPPLMELSSIVWLFLVQIPRCLDITSAMMAAARWVAFVARDHILDQSESAL